MSETMRGEEKRHGVCYYHNITKFISLCCAKYNLFNGVLEPYNKLRSI